VGEKAFLWVGRGPRLGELVIFLTSLPGGGIRVVDLGGRIECSARREGDVGAGKDDSSR
jgi:hypothetical protein